MMIDFVHTWFVGYFNPNQFIARLEGKPAPHWGIYAQGLRVLLDSLLLYLPLVLLGRQPSTASSIDLFPTESYYATMLWLQPFVIFTTWLLSATLVHAVLRLLGRQSDIDLILNLTGMSALVVGAFLLVWDWIFISLGGQSDIALGVSHWIFSLWGAAITVMGLKRYLSTPIWLGVLLYLLAALVIYPQAMLFIRGPL